MSDNSKKFHEFAIQTILFKGRADWYFCFLKSEKIAHVMALLLRSVSAEGRQPLQDLSRHAAHLPQEIAHFAAGETDMAFVLADIFSLLSSVRLSVEQGALTQETAAVIAGEYELLARKLQGGGQMSPFVAAEDFTLPEMPAFEDTAALPAANGLRDIHRDNTKGHKGHSTRSEDILAFIRQRSPVSIKEIAEAITGCSEKTIQRELGFLIERGLVKREGERRWSVYRAVL